MSNELNIRVVFSGRNSQKGAVLIVSMLLLTVMTLIGVTSMSNTTLEERMSGNTRDLQLAFNATEGALRHSESLLEKDVLPAFKDYDGLNTGGYYNPDDSIWTKIVDWTIAGNKTINCGETTLAANVLGIAAQPTCYIEELPPVKFGADLEAGTPLTQNMYRITARAVGGTENAAVILQETYRRF